MKGTFIILFLISSLSLVFAADQVTCPRYQCSARGESCGGVEGGVESVYTNCKNYDDQCILTDSGRDFETGTCQAKAAIGQTCGRRTGDTIDNYVECVKGSTCSSVGITPTCVAVTATTTAGPGKYCDTTTGCLTGVCSNNVCPFTADGQTCASSSECHYESTCVFGSMSTTGVCTPYYIAEGGACVVNGTNAQQRCEGSDDDFVSGSCVPNGVNDFNGICRLSFSQKKGHACLRTDQCEKGYCTNAGVSNLYGTCAKTRKTSTKDQFCVDQSDCTSDNGEICVCNGDEVSDVKCKVMDFSAKDFANYYNLKDCARSQAARCGDYTKMENAACIINACKKDYCAAYKETKAFGGVPFSYDRCAAIEVCAGSSVYASLPLMIVIALAVMFFY